MTDTADTAELQTWCPECEHPLHEGVCGFPLGDGATCQHESATAELRLLHETLAPFLNVDHRNLRHVDDRRAGCRVCRGGTGDFVCHVCQGKQR